MMLDSKEISSLYLDGGTIVGCGGDCPGSDLKSDRQTVVEHHIIDWDCWKFFEKHSDFKKQSRENAPNEIKSCSEFTSVYPDSAAYMIPW